MDDDTLLNKLSSMMKQLSLSNERNEIMNELLILASSCHPLMLSEIVVKMDLSPLFECMYENNSDDVSDAAEVLNKLLIVISPQLRIMLFKDRLIQGLKHSSVVVREMVLTQLELAAQNNTALEEIASSQELLCYITRLLGDDNMCVAKHSMSVLKALGKDFETVKVLFSPPVSNILNNLLVQTDVIKFRVYEVIVSIACTSPEALTETVKSGHLQIFLNEVLKNDVLVVLNCLELLTQLAITDHGLKHLSDVGLMAGILMMALNCFGHPLCTLILPGFMKFFGSIGYLKPDYLFNCHARVIELLFSLLEDNEPVLRNVAVDTIGLLGSTVGGKLMLHKQGAKMLQCMKIFGQLLQRSKPEDKIRIVEAIANLMKIKESEKNADVENILELWFRQIETDPTSLIMSLCKQPFGELRCSALTLVMVMATHIWGQKELSSFPGFVEYLLDRSTESDKEGKEAKYNIVRALVESSSTVDIFDAETIFKFEEYYKQGPFFVKAYATVAVEGAS